MRLNVLIVFMIMSTITTAQNTLTFQPMFGTQQLHLNNTSYTLENSKRVQFNSLRFYITHIEFLHNNAVVWKELQSYHLLNADSPNTLHIQLQPPGALQYNALRFNVGVDSTTTVAGIMGGDLDPTQGMYWTWQSGYINFKLEGTCTDAPTRNNEFQYHLGGYISPFNTLQTITLPVNSTTNITIAMDIQKFVLGLNIKETYRVMSPNTHAVELSQKLSSIFSVQQP